VIRTLRAYFMTRLLREKILLVALLLLVAVLWFSNLAGRLEHFRHDAYQAGLKLEEHSHWLAHRGAIEDSARKAASIFDPTRTLDSTQLLATVNAVAKDTGLRTTTSAGAQDVSNGEFAIHTVQFNMTKVDWSTLQSFYTALQQHAPYLGIDQFQLDADHANPNLLSVSLRISSVEIVRPQ
jgi:Type II secretion system (T2SS), protein M subtype b